MYRLMTFAMFAATCISCMQSQPGSGELQNKSSVLNADTSSGDNEISSVYAAQQVSASSGGTMSVSEESMNESLRGVTISIPPGALAIDTTIVIKEVTDVANSFSSQHPDMSLIPDDFTEVSEITGANPLPIGVLLKKAP